MKKMTATLFAAMLLVACGSDTTEEEVVTEPTEAAEPQDDAMTMEEYEALGEDIVAWAKAHGAPDDVVELEEGLAVSDSAQTLYGFDCNEVARLTAEGGDYGPGEWVEEDDGTLSGGEPGYAHVCKD